MKKFILCSLIIFVFSLSGCNNEAQRTEASEKSETFVESDTSVVTKENDIQADDSWKYEVAERLYEEMCYFYDNMEEHEIIEMAKKSRKYVNRNEVSYNCVMAVDRGCGIGQVYYRYLSEEKVNDVLDKLYNLEYVDYFSSVSFGYMETEKNLILRILSGKHI